MDLYSWAQRIDLADVFVVGLMLIVYYLYNRYLDMERQYEETIRMLVIHMENRGYDVFISKDGTMITVSHKDETWFQSVIEQ